MSTTVSTISVDKNISGDYRSNLMNSDLEQDVLEILKTMFQPVRQPYQLNLEILRTTCQPLCQPYQLTISFRLIVTTR